jgi:hypothetical protein
MSSTQGKTGKTKPQVPARTAEIVREYGPFAGAEHIHGITYDGRRVWAAIGSKMIAFDPESGQLARTLDRVGDAGTAFDGTYLYQIAEARIDKIDPATGDVVASIPAPGHGNDSGLAWAEGHLWVGQYQDRKIHQIDREPGAILHHRSSRFVTGDLGRRRAVARHLRRRHTPNRRRRRSSGSRCRAAPPSAVSSRWDGPFCGGGPSGRSAPCDVQPTREKTMNNHDQYVNSGLRPGSSCSMRRRG